MSDTTSRPPTGLALNTRLEEEFVSPLTAVRAALEILRDHAELPLHERARFIQNALQGCARLEQGVQTLADAVYAAGVECAAPPIPVSPHAERIKLRHELQVVEVDLSDLVFRDSRSVNDFYDALDTRVAASGERWYFLVNYHNCSVWPGAWVAFAHRGKKVNVSYSLGTVRYGESGRASGPERAGDTDSREQALQRIEALRCTSPQCG